MSIEYKRAYVCEITSLCGGIGVRFLHSDRTKSDRMVGNGVVSDNSLHTGTNGVASGDASLFEVGDMAVVVETVRYGDNPLHSMVVEPMSVLPSGNYRVCQDVTDVLGITRKVGDK